MPVSPILSPPDLPALDRQPPRSPPPLPPCAPLPGGKLSLPTACSNSPSNCCSTGKPRQMQSPRRKSRPSPKCPAAPVFPILSPPLQPGIQPSPLLQHPPSPRRFLPNYLTTADSSPPSCLPR